jgi:3'-phosphoadenosine 5'-phosphosulfate sulfotransferase (PAPS reductase)/FAD synthetase
VSDNPYLIQGPALISFSGGRTSAYMLKHILDAHGGTLPKDVHVVFANTGREMPETLDFVQECADRWNVRIVWLEYDPDAEHKTAIVSHNSASRNGEPFAALIRAKGYLPNPLTRFCSIEMKIRRCKEYMHRMLGYETWTTALGLRADEMRRVNKIGNARERWTNIAPLATAGVTKRNVVAWWAVQPFDLRLPNVNGNTAMGNCELCMLKPEATLRGIIHQRPDLAEWWVRMEAEAETMTANPDGARFRIDRPSYAEMLSDASRQGDLIDFLTDGGSVDCRCTD